MTILFDARGNPFQGSLDAIGGETFTDARIASATLGGLNAELVMDLNGKATATFDIRSAANSATYIFEGTEDGTNYYQLPARAYRGLIGATIIDEQIFAVVTPTTTIGAVFIIGVTGLRRVRCRVSAYTSGNAVVTGRASVADYAILATQQPALLNVTLAPAVNTGGTITLPAGGAGTYQYITAIQITLAMNPATAQTGAATVFITTTNLPGNPAWAVPIAGNAAASTGGLGAAFAPIINASFPNPLKASVANTATTFVLPAPGAACTFRANVQYYLGL